ncbi:MAG: zinc protease [Sphingomonadales bacterium]|nr:zinc protease [Sphingomonadales bacterium]
MLLLRRFAFALLLLVAAPVWAAGDSHWLYRGSDIAPDPSWTFGTLPNGLRYAVRRNANPAGQVSVRLRMDVGALMEADRERGWAHFIEHMVFRGTEHFGDGEARETWQRLGASFGSDTNATTDATQTVFMLDLPHADRASLDTSLALLAEMTDKAKLDPAIVEAERGVVLSERGRRRELDVKLWDTMRPLFFAGTKYADRDTIGTPDTLQGADATGLMGFYERWYRPERATLVMVGDADPAMMEALIAARFGGWKGTGPAPREPDYGRPAKVATPVAAIAYPGSPYLATLDWTRPYVALPPTVARERTDLARALARRILNRRLEAKARGGDAAFLNAGVQSERSVHIADTTRLAVMAKEGKWREALDQAYAILADALKAPPAEAEVQRELTNLRTAWVAAVQGEPTQLSQAKATSLVTAVDRNDVVAAAPAMLALFDRLAPQMTSDAVEAEMRAMFAGEGPRLVMLSPAALQGLGEALAAAEKAAPAARQGERRVSLDDLPAPGAPGREISRQRIEDLDATLVRFANGSALVFKHSDFEKGSVNVELRFGAGRSGLPADRKTLAWAAPVLGSTGVGPLDLDGLERLLTGRRMTIGFDMADDAWELTGTTSPAELGDQLRLLAAKLVAPHWDPSLVDRFQASALENFDLSFSSAASRIGREFGGVTHQGDKRWAPLERSDLAALTPGAFEAFFAPVLKEGPIEVVIVGDVDLETAVAAMAKTVAALPTRPPVPGVALGIRPPRPEPPATFDHRGDANQAYAMVGWSTLGGFDHLRERRALSLGGNLVSARLLERLRDQAGASYSPQAGASSSETFPEWGIFYAGSELTPDKTDLFFRLARETVADLAAHPAAADEFARAQNPIVAGLERRMRTNGYWVGAMEGWSAKPQLIEQVRSLLADYRGLTAEEVRAAIAKYVTDEGDWSILVVPAKAASGVH